LGHQDFLHEHNEKASVLHAFEAVRGSREREVPVLFEHTPCQSRIRVRIGRAGAFPRGS